jgi:hypothetical protein
VLALIALLVPLPRSLVSNESSFFAPAIATTRYAVEEGLSALESAIGRGGLSQRDALAVVLLAVGVVTAVLWRAAPRRGPGVAMAAAALVQVGMTGLAFASIDGRVNGVEGRTGTGFATLGFIDRATGDRDVTWLDNQPRKIETAADVVQRTALLYNDTIIQRMALSGLAITPDNFPLDALPLAPATVTRDGRLAPALSPTRHFVSTVDSPFAQLNGAEISRSRTADRLQVVRVNAPLSLRWQALGLQSDGGLPARSTARVFSWGMWRVRMHLRATRPARATLKLGSARRALRVAAPGRSVNFTTCGRAAGSLRTSRRIVIAAVTMSKIDGGRCAS